jgi:hypothetical protein
VQLDALESELAEASLSHKDWVKAADLMRVAAAEESWRDSGLRSFSAWVESLATKYKVSASWLWRAQKAAEYLPEVWPHHHPEPAPTIRGILDQVGRNISPAGICALATLAGRRLSDKFLRSIEKAYFLGCIGVTELWEICKEVEAAKQRRIEPEVYSVLFRSDFSEIFHGFKYRLISDVGPNCGYDALFVLTNGEDEPSFLGVRLGSSNQSPAPRSLDFVAYLVSDEASGTSFLDRAGILRVDTATAQVRVDRPWERLEPIKTRKAALSQAVLNHLLAGSPMRQGTVPAGGDEA